MDSLSFKEKHFDYVNFTRYKNKKYKNIIN